MKQYEKTGALIASVRKEKGLTQKELAVTLHVSDTTVSKWERGGSLR
jgi:DNA-binding transcriptional regulator YiaG